MSDTHRAKPIKVAAFKWDGRDLDGLGRWAMHADIAGRRRRGETIPRDVFVSHPIDGISLGGGRWRLEIKTPDGIVKPAPGDFIVCLPDGSFNACKPHLFDVLFEQVGAEPS